MAKVKNPATGRLVEDYSGQTFGGLTAIRPVGGNGGYGPIWEFRCTCGNTVDASIKNVKSGRQKSCGCRLGDTVFHRQTGKWAKNLTGKTIGKWTVLRLDENSDEVRWICRCECGTVRSVARKSLTSGRTLSCGECTRPEAVAKAMKKRVYKLNTDIPAKADRLYRVWGSMKARCYNENAHDYPRYGGRGITICDEWRDSFFSFKEWALSAGYDYDAPRMACTLDRIDNDGPYSPDNCRWVSMKKQIANQRRPDTPTLPDNRRAVVLVNNTGDTIRRFESAAEASRETGCNPSSITRVCKEKQRTTRGLQWRYAE